MNGAVTVTRDGAVARVTLSRPEVRNAFNAELIADLHDAFATLAVEPPEALRAVVLAGEGAAFCAGADVAWMRASVALSVEDNEADARRMAEMLATIDACPVPVIARVHGAALGGGMGLCAVADIALAASDTVFGFTETKLGILPAVISPFVIARIGEGQARALFPTGERFDAERALRIGLVHEVLADELALDERVAAVVGELLSAGPVAARAAKAIIRDQRGLSAGEKRSLTVEAIARLRVSPEGQEGLTAYLDKRPAVLAGLSEQAPGAREGRRSQQPPLPGFEPSDRSQWTRSEPRSIHRRRSWRRAASMPVTRPVSPIGTTTPAPRALRWQVEGGRPVGGPPRRAFLRAVAQAALGEAFPEQAFVLTAGEGLFCLKDAVTAVDEAGMARLELHPINDQLEGQVVARPCPSCRRCPG